MKKMLTVFLAVALIILFQDNYKTAAQSAEELWPNLKAEVSAEVYSILQNRAGFAAYIYTDTNFSMYPDNLSNLIIKERKENYFIGRYETDSTEILVTTDGLIVAFTPKDVAHTIFPNDLHFQHVQSAVKVLTGKLIEKVNYINFLSLESNKALSYFEESTINTSLNPPANAVVNTISYANVGEQKYSALDYGWINPASLTPNRENPVHSFGKYIDNILVFNKPATVMNVFYSSDKPIIVKGTENVKHYELVDNFIVDTSEEPKIELLQLNSKESSLFLKPGKSELLHLTGIYSDGTVEAIDPNLVKWSASNRTVAKLSNGKVEALNPGDTRINIEYEGKTTFVIVTVQDYKEIPIKLNQPVDKIWDVTFSATVYGDSTLPNNIYITDAANNSVPTLLVVSGDVVQIIPTVNYTPGESYTVWVKDVKSSTGKTINQYTKMDFTIKK